VLLACAALFVWRGPLRSAHTGDNLDAPLLMSAAAIYVHGENPYDPRAVSGEFGPNGRDRSAFPYRPPYSPAAYALISPLTWLPWPAQRVAWNALNTLLYLGALWLTLRLFQLSPLSVGGLALVATGLICNPAHTGIALGQTGVAVLFLLCASWDLGGVGETGRPLLSGSALGLALTLKPQLGLLFVAYDLYAGRSRVAIVAVGVATLAFALSLALHPAPIALMRGWLESTTLLMHGGDADPLAVPFPHQLINLESPLAVLTGSQVASKLSALALCALLALGYVAADRAAVVSARDHTGARDPTTTRARWLTGLAATAVLSLLVFYHRIYDAVVLLVPAAIAIQRIGARDPRGWLLALCLLPLFVPVTSAVLRLLAGPEGPSPVALSAWLMALVVQHQTWCLVGAFMVIASIRREAARPASVSAPALAA